MGAWAFFRRWLGADAPQRPLPTDPRAPVVLPAGVRDAIDGASVIARFSGPDGDARVLVHIAGLSGFEYSDEGASDLLRRLFPGELDERQQAAALRRFGFRIAAATGAAAAAIEERRARTTKIGGWRDPWAERDGKW